MPFSSLKKHSPSNLAPAIGLASHSQPVYPWSAHALASGKSPSPFPRYYHTLSTTATATGELFLFGGYTHSSPHNDIHVFSTRDFSTTLLQTSGEKHSPFGLGRVGEFQSQECAKSGPWRFTLSSQPRHVGSFDVKTCSS